MSQTQCPLLFTFTDKIEGNGFLAEVVAHGRALAVKESSDEVWMYGVNPGGVAATGKDETSAYLAFRTQYTTVLFDIASAVKTFEEFKVEVERFFDGCNRPTLALWEEAVRAVRAGKLDAKGIERQPAESPRFVEVTLKTKFAATDNKLDEPRKLAA